jgi:hypothetical protein
MVGGALAHRKYSKNHANIVKVGGYNPVIEFVAEDGVDVANGGVYLLQEDILKNMLIYW